MALPSGADLADRLAALVEERQSQIVLGLDPDPARLWPEAIARTGAAEAAPDERAALTAQAVAAHCRLAIGAAGPACVAVKPQLACFERLGAPGWRALAEGVEAAHQHHLLLIPDGQRGDVPQTPPAYPPALGREDPRPVRPVAVPR